jgi:hypothetical protein
MPPHPVLVIFPVKDEGPFTRSRSEAIKAGDAPIANVFAVANRAGGTVPLPKNVVAFPFVIPLASPTKFVL